MPAYTADALEKFAHTYSTYTAEVEGTDSYIFDDKIVIGKVLAWNPHPDSDKLWLVDIDAGKCGKHTIVCGATNAKTSHYVPVALENATLPGWLIIARRPIRGVDSCGMICSLDEIGLSSVRAEGILPLESVWEEDFLEKHLGEPFGSLSLSIPGYTGEIEYAMSDIVFDLDNKFITNRPDLFSVVGNAREIACIDKTPFLKVDGNMDWTKGDFEIRKITKDGNTLKVNIETDKVINYTLTKFSLPNHPETPLVLQILLKRSNQGLHGILPDLTNIVMTELGQPMHVFDADTVEWTITVRMAKKWETLEALDGKTYTLSDEDMVIADDNNILAIAGVIGGKNSGATETTRNILIEAATFDPVCVRKTSQRLGIRTDSSVRFEKGVDPQLPERASTRYMQLLMKYIPSSVYEGNFVYTTPKIPTNIAITHSYIEERIGTQVQETIIVDILTRLGFMVDQEKSTYKVTVPSWRDTGDITIAADIVEEVARMIGYDTLPGTPLPGPILTARNHAHDAITTKISHFFAHHAYFDAYTYPFTFNERFVRFSDKKPAIIHNTSENRTHLRANIAENLLELVASNYRTHTEGKFFEFGPIFDGEESLQGMGVVWWHSLEAIQDTLAHYTKTFFGIRGEIIQSETDTKLFAPKACGEIIDADGKILVRFGLIRPTLLPLFDISEIEVYAFEIVTLPDIHRTTKYTPIIEFPGTRRELNIIMPEDTPVKVALDIVSGSHEWISDVSVSEIYRDPAHIGDKKKSVVVSFLIQNPEATITDEEAGKIQEIIISNLAERGYKLRGV